MGLNFRLLFAYYLRRVCEKPSTVSLMEKVIKMYAIIETGGKQYRVAEGDTIKVEKLEAVAGDNFTFDKVLFVSGEEPKVGAPFVEGASVGATVLEQGKHKKVVAFKYKAKKGYRRKKGHRQPFTALKINAINA